MKLWIALGIAIAIGAYLYMNQPEQSTAPQSAPLTVTEPPPRAPSPPPQKSRPVSHTKKSAQLEENTINEENFVEADEEVTPEQKAPDALQYKKNQEESTPLAQLTNFEPNQNRNQMVTLTYGSDPKANLKIEDREVRRRRAFVAAEGDQ
jgi:hypothetical protein